MAELITLDGRLLTGRDRFGDWKVTSDLEGWWNTPDRKSQDSSIENADGSSDTRDYYEERNVTIEGRVKTASHDAQHHAMNWLAGALSLAPGRLVVAGHGGDQWAMAKLAGSTRFTVKTDRYVQWQVRLKFPDPRKFGELRTFKASPGNNVAIYHMGNYRATPKFTVTGSMPGGYEVGVGGLNYTVTRALTSNAPHTFDYRNGRLRVNGSLVTGGVSYAALRSIDPGQRDTLTIAPLTSGTGSVVCEVLDTFI